MEEYGLFLLLGICLALTTLTLIISLSIVKSAHKETLKVLQQATLALATTIDAKDNYIDGHSHRVADYAVAIAKKAGKTAAECEQIRLIALLHDIGKIGIPDAIICKPSSLTDEEYDIVKTHSAVGREILSKISLFPELTIGASFHHERYDGTGYPFGLKGEEIPEIARIISVADTYDAMASKRSYRDILPKEKIREELVKGMGTQFDPKFAKIMIDFIDEGSPEIALS